MQQPGQLDAAAGHPHQAEQVCSLLQSWRPSVSVFWLVDRMALTKPSQASVPSNSQDSPASTKVAAAALTNTRHCCETIKASGMRMPKCGLKVRKPIRMPARTGRHSIASSAPPNSAAVMQPFCPTTTLASSARKGAGQQDRAAVADDLINHVEIRQRIERRPDEIARGVGQQRERREHHHVVRRIELRIAAVEIVADQCATNSALMAVQYRTASSAGLHGMAQADRDLRDKSSHQTASAALS